MGVRWDITSRRHGLLPSGGLPCGHGGRVVTTVGVVAASVFGASACGTEPRVDEVRVSVTTPVLGGHRLSEVTASDEAIDINSGHVHSADITAGGQYRVNGAAGSAHDDMQTVTGLAASVMAGSPDGAAGHPTGEVPPPESDVGGVGANTHDATAGLAMTPEASGVNSGGDALSPDSGQPDVSIAHGTTHGDAAVHVADDQSTAETQGVATGDMAMNDPVSDASVDDAPVNDAWVSESTVGDADVPASDRAAIDTAVHRMWSSHVAARRAPTNTTTVAAALAAVSGQAQRWVRRDIESLATTGQVAMADPFVPGALVVHAVQPVDGDRVVATVCSVDTDQVWTVATAVDSDPLVVRAGATRVFHRLGLIRAGDIWMVDDVVVDYTEMLGIDAAMSTGCR